MRVNKASWRELTRAVFVRKECTPSAPNGDLQKAGNELIMKIAKAHGVPLLLTLDAHFVNKDQKIIQDLLLQNGHSEEVGLKFHTKYYQLNTEEAWAKWVNVHGKDMEREFVEGVENNHALASMCEPIKIKKEYHLPEIELPREVLEISTDTATRYREYLFKLIDRYGRFRNDDVGKERLRRELKLIADNGKVNFLPYFFAIHNFCEDARASGVMVGAGRGSAGGCYIAYLLNITQLDPIEYGLSFERFLNTGRINRGKLPDIDVDFSDPGKLVEILKAKYGDKFIRICTTGTNKVKNAIRDVSRVLLGTKIDPEMKERVEKVCKSVNDIPQGHSDLVGWLEGWSDSEGNYHLGELEVNNELKEFFDEFSRVADLVKKVLGIPKALGRHASAYCLSDVPVVELVPVCRINDEECTQFTMEAVEAIGLVKFDLLGLNTLKDIGNCVKLVMERHGVELDIYNLPMDDLIFDEFCQGKTETVFQFNGDVPTQTCVQVQPRSILDLASITAACRPGTMYAKMVDEGDSEETTLIELWKARRQGKKKISFLHEDLEQILAPTDGIVLFQEQISAIFEKACGYTPEQADEMREIVGKKQADTLNERIPDIRARLIERGWNAQQITALISLCKASANYAFNKSHSACYSYMAYICMWLKGHYPLEWWTAILQNCDHEDLEENAKYFHPVIKHPDVNVSEVNFYIIDDKKQKIVYPLTMIKGIKKASEQLFLNRPYKSLKELFLKVDRRVVSKKVITALIWAGALDEMEEAVGKDTCEKRNTLMRTYLKMKFEMTKKKEDKIEHDDLSWGEVQMLESKSLCIGNPDIVSYFRDNGKISCVDIFEALGRHDGARVCTAGVITDFRKFQDKKKRDMCFIEIGNKEHKVNVTCFSKLYEEVSGMIEKEKVMLVYGRVNVYGGRKSIVADNLEFCEIEDI